jgi:hypothetical protein
MAPQAPLPGADIAHARAVLRRPFVQAEEGTDVLRIIHRIPALGAVLTAAATVLLAAAGPASAADSAGADPCAAAPSSRPFAAWGDNANYVPVPGGAFETGDCAWTLASGAALAAGNETFKVRASTDVQSLSLPAGAVATSPEMQIGLAYPTLRLFARSTAEDGRLTVHVLFHTPDKVQRQLKIADLSAGEAWQPTRVVFILANLLALYPGWDKQVQFRFTANGGSWQVDDVYVDPYER